MTLAKRAPRRSWAFGGRKLMLAATAILGCISATLTGCGTSVSPESDGRLKVVTTTGILADLVRNVGGREVDVTSLVPLGADPHSYEPSLRNVRDVAYADIAFSNYLLLEEQSTVRMLDANLQPGVKHVMVAEAAAKFGASVMPMVENRALDTTWLGLRVRGAATQPAIPKTAKVTLAMTDFDGPGNAAAFVTESFGAPKPYFTSKNGVDDSDTVSMPLDAHSHLSWAFTEPGVYKMSLAAYVHEHGEPIGTPLTRGTLTFAVGVNPHEVAPGKRVLDNIHADLTTDLATGKILYQVDNPAVKKRARRQSVESARHSHSDMPHYDFTVDDVVVAVPTTTLTTVPANRSYSFLDRPGQPIYMLAQAVLGKHVHGEIDPHLWLDAANAAAYVDLIEQELSMRAPKHAPRFRQRARAYRQTLLALDQEIKDSLAQVPEARRQLVTNHDAFAYFADAYGLNVAGFVTPNPSTQPSVAERAKLARTISDLNVPAVFLEPTSRTRSSTLDQVAEDAGIKVCDILSDSFIKGHDTYVKLMRFNERSIRQCLGDS